MTIPIKDAYVFGLPDAWIVEIYNVKPGTVLILLLITGSGEVFEEREVAA